MFNLKTQNSARQNKILPVIAIVFPVLVILFWQYASTHGLVKASLVPAPLTIAKTFLSYIESGKLWKNLAKVLKVVQRVDDWMAESEDNQKKAFTTLAEITQREETWFSTMYSGSNFGINLTEQDLRVLGEVLEFMKSNDLLSNPDITMDDILELKYLEMAGYR